MQTRVRRAAVLALMLVLATFGTTAVGSSAEAAGSKKHGCPYGAVCVYPGTSWNGDRPSLFFYSYGGHNLTNQVHKHRVLNNQSGDAYVWLCKGYDGKGGFITGWNPVAYYSDVDLTPVNSIQLTPEPTDIRQEGCHGGRRAVIP